MVVSRRNFLFWMGAMSVTPLFATAQQPQRSSKMYGLIGKMLVIANAREQLTQILLDGVAGMPGCLSYVVANDMQDENAIWITEVWESKALHEASLSLDSVQQAIAKGRPLIAGFGERFETIPVGGQGL